MFTPRASASTSRGWAYSRSIRSRTRRSSARSRRFWDSDGLLVTCAIVPRRSPRRVRSAHQAGAGRRLRGVSVRRLLPLEAVRVGEGAVVAVEHDPVRSGAVRRHPGVLGQGATAVEGQRDGARRGVELDVLPAEALPHGEAPVDVELLAREHVLGSQEEYEAVDLPGGRTLVLLGRGGDLPERPVGCLDDASVAPEGLLDRLHRRGTRRE